MRVTLNGTVYRYVYAGSRVLEETTDAGGLVARYSLVSGSYYAPWVATYLGGLGARFPLMDGVGTTRRLVTSGNTAWDQYSLDAFGADRGSWTNYHNPYRFGGAWGYITDTPGSGLLQLGARFYWPELGRFIQQDPVGNGMNWYGYAGGNPVVWIDPTGLDDSTSFWHYVFYDPCSWSLAKQGAAAWVDGLIPFVDPLAGYYDSSNPYLQASRSMGGATRDIMIAAGGAPNLLEWLKNPVLYEIGQTTVPGGVYKAMEGMGAVEKGGYLLSNYGLRGLPGLSYGALRTGQFANTIGTGLTPGGYLFSAGAVHGLDRYASGHW